MLLTAGPGQAILEQITTCPTRAPDLWPIFRPGVRDHLAALAHQNRSGGDAVAAGHD